MWAGEETDEPMVPTGMQAASGVTLWLRRHANVQTSPARVRVNNRCRRACSPSSPVGERVAVRYERLHAAVLGYSPWAVVVWLRWCTRSGKQ